MNNSKESVTAIFLGYQASGKTTFLTAMVLASLQNKINVAITEEVKEEQSSFFDSRITELINRGRVEKTEINSWFDLSLNIEFLGEDRILCETIDYPGEYAEVKDKSGKIPDLLDFIEHSHCLYLFFDCDLSPKSLAGCNKNVEKEMSRQLRGQTKSINYARNLFADRHPERPVIIVVMKADLLFSDEKPEIIEQRIEKLNKNDELAVKKFIEIFGSQAKIVLESKQQSPIKICYVAALGTNPDFKTDNEGRKAYYISDINKWKPIGFVEALHAGLFSGVTLRNFIF